MKLFFRLLTLFMAIPVIELALLLQVSKWMGFWPTVALILATALAGSYLAKREGLSAWNRLQGRLGEGGLPGDELLDAVIILVAGAFLITPGVLTDVVGFTGMLPFTRGWIRRLVKRRLKKAMREGRLQTSFSSFGTFGPGDSGMASAEDDAAAADAAPEPDGPDVGGTPSKRGPAPSAASGDGADAPGTPPASPGERPGGEASSNGTDRPQRLGEAPDEHETTRRRGE